MLRRRFLLQPTAAYSSGHELDHADPPTRSGQLPRPLVAVSNVLTRAALSRPPATTTQPSPWQVMPRTEESSCRTMDRAQPRSIREARSSTRSSPASCSPSPCSPRPARSGSCLLGLQAVLFAVAVALGVQRTPAAFLFRRFVRPRLSAPTHLEDPRASALRAGCRPGLHPGRSRRLPRRCSAPRRGRHGLRTGGGPAQRSLRLLPGLRDVSADPPGRPGAQHQHHHRTHQRLGRNTKEEEATHEPRNRTGHRRVGRGPSRRSQHRAGRGRRGHHVVRQGPHQGGHQARLDHRPAGPGPS